MKWSCVFAVLLLSGCEVARPEGAFVPEVAENDAGLSQVFGRKDGGRDARGQEPGDASDPEDEPSDEPEDEEDEDLDDEPVEPAEPVDPSHPLAALSGRYLLRMDMYSTVEAQDGLTTLRVRNRISNLVLAELSTGEGERNLVSREVLCHQVYVHVCEKGCSDWTTSVDPDVGALLAERSISRELEYDRDAQRLTAAEGTLSLGFDEEDGDSSLPADPEDARVWSLGAGSQQRSGLFIELAASVPPLRLDCLASTVQRFVSRFGGALGKSSALSIEGAAYELDTAGTDGRTIWAQGTPTSYCTTAELNRETAAEQGAQTVRFARFTGSRCPAPSEFDRALPAKAP